MTRISDYTVIDLEMTGLAAKSDKIIEIGAVKVRGREVVDTFGTLVNPTRSVPETVTALTGITDEMLKKALSEDEAMEMLLAFLGEDIIVGHNVSFDYGFMKQWAANHKRSLEAKACDTLRMARTLLPGEQSKKLESLCELFSIARANAHRALDDALETQQIYEILADMAEEKSPGILTPQVLTYKAKRQTPATKHQIERLKEIRALNHITDEIYWETLTRSQASRLQDQYYARYGRN